MNDESIAFEAAYACRTLDQKIDEETFFNYKDEIVTSCAVIRNVNGRIYTFDLDGRYSAYGAITVLPGMQIALGARMEDYIEMLKYSTLPIEIETGGHGEYFIQRRATGVLDKRTLMKVTCSFSGEIVCVHINNHIMYDRDYRRLMNVSSMMQIALDDDDKIVENAIRVVEKIGYRHDGVKVIFTSVDVIDILMYNENDLKKRNRKGLKRSAKELFPIKFTFAKYDIVNQITGEQFGKGKYHLSVIEIVNRSEI